MTDGNLYRNRDIIFFKLYNMILNNMWNGEGHDISSNSSKMIFYIAAKTIQINILSNFEPVVFFHFIIIFKVRRNILTHKQAYLFSTQKEDFLIRKFKQLDV